MLRAEEEPRWSERIESLRERTQVKAALENADLLADAASRWRGKVVPRTAMHDLLFTRLGDQYPFPRFVKVAFNPDDETFTFMLYDSTTDDVIAGDKARHATAPAVLDAFLMQLTAAMPLARSGFIREHWGTRA